MKTSQITQIECPNCHSNINVQELVSKQLEENLKSQIQADFEVKLELALQQKQKELRKQIEIEQTTLVQSLRKELESKSNQVNELYETKAEIERLKREKQSLRSEIVAEQERKLNTVLTQELERVRSLEHEKSELKIRELHKQLEDQKNLTEEMKRKQEQGSMQLQGEVQELAIEEYLKTLFPLDTIEEIKKGTHGADCIQTIHSHTKQNCGMIYYESKRTREFNKAWIGKFKDDIRDKNANVGVLVTETMPQGMDRMGLIDGVWVCTFTEFKSLCKVLRYSIIQICNATTAQENKGEKMVMLYDFLTSNEFKLQIESIIDGFSQLKIDLDKEKRAMNSIWKLREKQIEKVLLNTNHMYSCIKGIAGNSVNSIQSLNLPGVDQE